MRVRPDVTAYLLGEADAAERARAEELMRTDPGFRAEVERLRPVVARLAAMPAEAWTPAEPPPLDVDIPVEPEAARRRRPRLSLRPAVAVACSVALLAAGIGAGALIAGGGDGAAPSGAQVALAPVGGADAGAGGTVKLAAVKGAEPGGGATVTVHGLKPLPDGGYYELWMLNSPTDLVSMGSFTVDASGTATVTLPVAADPAKFKFFDVSVEPGDGKPGHSGISVLRAPTTAA
ncbi:MAG: anti-sigma factor [Solirubrobacteraceae bacterium]